MNTMQHPRTHEVTAFYDDREQARAAVRRLNDAGIPTDDVRLVEGNDPSANAGTRPEEDRGFLDMLGDFFMPEEDRRTYAEGLHRGGYVVSARVSAEHHERVAELLDDDHGVDLDERENAWRGEGWGGGAAAPAAGGTATSGTTDGDHEGTIEVAEERLKVGKRDVSHGRVKVRSYVVEDQVSEDVALTTESVDIERRPVDRAVADADSAFRERAIEVEETAEEAVVEKEARVVEEIDVGKHVETEVETVSDTVRRTEVEVEDERR